VGELGENNMTEEQARGILAAKTAARDYVLRRLIEDKTCELQASPTMAAKIVRDGFDGLARLTNAQLAKAAHDAGISGNDQHVLNMTTVLAQLASAT
jgi:predicted YcjX-like family ATPase